MKNFAHNHSLGVVLMAALLFLAIAPFSHCATSAPPRDNAFGALIYQDNPNQYTMGQIKSGQVVKRGDKRITVLEVLPTNTYGLFSEVLQFCGNQADMINGHTGVVVFTYSKVRHTVDCNDLYRVDDVGGNQ